MKIRLHVHVTMLAEGVNEHRWLYMAGFQHYVPYHGLGYKYIIYSTSIDIVLLFLLDVYVERWSNEHRSGLMTC